MVLFRRFRPSDGSLRVERARLKMGPHRLAAFLIRSSVNLKKFRYYDICTILRVTTASSAVVSFFFPRVPGNAGPTSDVTQLER